MNLRHKLWAIGFLTSAFSSFCAPFPTTRDPLKWPFAQNSCWNMPIGDKAEYIAAGIKASPSTEWRPDMDIIVMKPKAPLTKIYFSSAGWGGGNRCLGTEKEPRFSVPIPDSFIIKNENTNASAAFISADGRTVKQCQPFSRCEPFAIGTSMFFFDKPVVDRDNGTLYQFHDMDIQDSTGEVGGHWGSKLSNLGGTIRVGEFTEGVIRHAMKVNLYAFKYFYYEFNCSATNKDSCSFRWPALSVDHYAYDLKSKIRYAGTDKKFIMGVLLALQPTFKLDSIKTVPGKILAKAFQDYGAYVVDDAACDCWAPVFERGPDGDVIDEVKKLYNVNMFLTPRTDEFWKDMVKVFEGLHIISNNSKKNIGGGGVPRQPLAPPFENAGTRIHDLKNKGSDIAAQRIEVSLKKENAAPVGEGTKRVHTILGEQVPVQGKSEDKPRSPLSNGVYIIGN